MQGEVMDLEQVARYLRRDAREVARLAKRGHLPARKVAGEWRFSRAEVTHWVETQIYGYSEAELVNLEAASGTERADPIVGRLLPEACVAVPLEARTKSAVLAALVAVAERSWHVYDPQAILSAIKQREEMASTALEMGVALPHPHRPLPGAVGETVIAYGRTLSGIAFGGPRGTLTDIFFLICSADHQTHLKVLARLSRLLLRPGLLPQLRQADTSAETFQILESAERGLAGLE
jgi:PTS system nitrogen regulatory IIA component